MKRPRNRQLRCAAFCGSHFFKHCYGSLDHSFGTDYWSETFLRGAWFARSAAGMLVARQMDQLRVKPLRQEYELLTLDDGFLSGPFGRLR